MGVRCYPDTGDLFYGEVTARVRGVPATLILAMLFRRAGRLIPYLDLMKTIKPKIYYEQVRSLSRAPQEVQSARRVINEALLTVGAPFKVRAIKYKGLILNGS
jgi:hypothetical protein